MSTGYGKKIEREDEMRKLDANTAAPFQKIAAAARITGLSTYFLRNGCKDGTVPHLLSGTTYYINVPRLLEQLDAGPVGARAPLPERENKGATG